MFKVGQVITNGRRSAGFKLVPANQLWYIADLAGKQVTIHMWQYSIIDEQPKRKLGVKRIDKDVLVEHYNRTRIEINGPYDE
jgi:hypothetical protein